MSDKFEFEWAGAQEIDVVGAVKIAVDPTRLDRYLPGGFTFADGTVGGWTLDQMYDADTDPPRQYHFPVPSPGNGAFTLSNHQGLGLAATTSFLLGPKSAQMIGFYFVSPDLHGSTEWDDCTGFRLDFQRDYFSWLNMPKLHQVQLQADFSVPNQRHLERVVEAVGGTAAYHDTAHMQPYAFSWTADQFSNEGWALRHLRVFCRMVNVASVAGGELATGSQGAWLIGNVRPLH